MKDKRNKNISTYMPDKIETKIDTDIEDYLNKNTPCKKNRTKREQKKKYKKHLKFLANIYEKYYFYPPVYQVNDRYCKRLYHRKNHDLKKRHRNKIIRRYKGKLNNGSSYKKITGIGD